MRTLILQSSVAALAFLSTACTHRAPQSSPSNANDSQPLRTPIYTKVQSVELSCSAQSPQFESRRSLTINLSIDSPHITPAIRFERGVTLTTAVDSRGRDLAKICRTNSNPDLYADRPLYKGQWREASSPRTARCAIQDIPPDVDAISTLRGYLDYQIPTATKALKMSVDHDGETTELAPGVMLSARTYLRSEQGSMALEITLDRSQDPTWTVGDTKSPTLAEVVIRQGKAESRLMSQTGAECTATPTGWRITLSPDRRNPRDADQPLDCTIHLVMSFEEGRSHFELSDIHLND